MADSKRVIVAGGGPAGMVAAIAAARHGAQVELIESTGCLGGMLTSGLLSFWGSFDDLDRQRDMDIEAKIWAEGHTEETWPAMQDLPTANRIIGGIAEELLQRLEGLGGALNFGTGCIPINPETAKYDFDKIMLENNVKIRYYTQVAEAVLTENRITSIVTASKDGLKNEPADIFIDATGDGDLSAFAGVPYEKGRDEDELMQSVTLVFRLGGVEGFFGRCYADAAEIGRCNEAFREAQENGEVSGQYHVGCINSIPGLRDVVVVNSQHTHCIDGTSAEDLSRAIVNGRAQVRELAALFKKHLRGFENSYLLDTAQLVGVRETRRIKGEYTLTEDDVISGRKFPDSVANGAWGIDCHLTPARPRTFEETHLNAGVYYNIPYRCLVPKSVDNLLLAGRCISTTHLALAAFRIMPQCMAVGQAAGTAAALCLEGNCAPRDLDVSSLQKALRQDGALL